MLTLNSLGIWYREMGSVYRSLPTINAGFIDNYTKAAEYLSRALTSCERTLGATHPHTLTVTLNYGLTFGDLKDYSNARIMFSNALKGYEEGLGKTTVKREVPQGIFIILRRWLMGKRRSWGK